MTTSDQNMKDWNGGLAEPTIKASITGFGEITTGAKFEIFGGTKSEFAAGAKNSVFLGLDNKISFGAKTDISAGSEVKITMGPKWTSPSSRWWPATGFMAKYDFSTIKEHKLIISPDGSTDILVKKQTLSKDHFQASAGYGLLGNTAYTVYTNVVSEMIFLIVNINMLLQSLSLLNSVLINPAYNRKEGFDWKSQTRTTWVPIFLQIMTTWGQLSAAINVVLSRDALKKAVSPKSVLQLRDGKGAFLGTYSKGVVSGIQQEETLKFGVRKPPLLERLKYAIGTPFEYSKKEVNGAVKKGDEIVGPKEPFESYFEAAQNKAIAFSKCIEIQANKDQKTKVKSEAGLLEPPNILIKADGDSKAKIVAQAKNITLRTESKEDANVKLILAQEKNMARLTIDKKEKNGLIMDNMAIALKNKKGRLEINNTDVKLQRVGKGGMTVSDSMVSISSGRNRIVLSSAGVKINGNLVVTQ